MKTHRIWSFLWLLVIFTSFSLVGCKCWNPPDCDTDARCQGYNMEGMVYCVDGRCVACRDGADCTGCSECRNGSCVALQCCATGECPEGQICQNHRCITGCDPDRPCPAGQQCHNNSCVDCVADSDCGANERCENNRCVSTLACQSREMQTVYFDFDESVIRRDQESRLNGNATCLREFPEDEITIEGHCDERGTDAYNMALGERRARSAKTYLGNLGIADTRMSTVSYGESRPVALGSNEDAWRRNRRTEFVWR
ncbi:MAG: OmpA family protein [Bradymonadales bacterium]|nr:OmpA family protein [Bradymonadales bacterium]